MKKTFSLSALAILFYAAVSAQNYQWAKSTGNTSYDVGYSIALDDSGNVYITGYFSDTADFDPAPDTANLAAVGFWDIFFAKYDANGNYLWAKSIGSVSSDYGHSIALDASGNVFITGSFQGSADFDPGAGTVNLTSVGSTDIFFAKYDANGNYLWAKSIGSTTSDYGTSIALDDSGNVFITGHFTGTADFDPATDTANLTAVGVWDIFFAKYAPNGNYMWAKSIGSTTNDYGTGIALDDSGNVYVTGLFTDTADFDPGAGTANLTSVGNYDIFFAKYDANGNYIWAKSIGSTSIDRGYSIALDDLGNVCITGLFSDTADFDPGVGTANLTSVGGGDIFFAKYENSGNYIWAKNIGSVYDDYGFSIALDDSGNVYITGIFQDTVDFDPGLDTFNITTAGGSWDIYFSKYDSNGNYLWAKSIGSVSDDYGYSIALDDSGNVYITGYFSSTADFDPGAGTANLTSVGQSDIFFAKYSQQPPHCTNGIMDFDETDIDCGGMDCTPCGGSCIANFNFFADTSLTASFTDSSTTSNPPFTSWFWDFGDGFTGNIPNISHTYGVSGAYNVCLTITDTSGCTDSICKTVTVVTTGINNQSSIPSNRDQFKIFPNPSRGVFTIECQMSDVKPVVSGAEPCQMLDIRVYDVLGREVYKTKVQSSKFKINPKFQAPRGEFEIDISGKPAGIYHLQLMTGNAVSNRKIVVE